jgi:hypothetical protein
LRIKNWKILGYHRIAGSELLKVSPVPHENPIKLQVAKVF